MHLDAPVSTLAEGAAEPFGICGTKWASKVFSLTMFAESGSVGSSRFPRTQVQPKVAAERSRSL